MKITIPIFTVILAGIIGSCAKSTEHLTVVQPFELKKYLGTWYEIARFDHSFERGLSNVTATYTPNGNAITVLNKGYHDASKIWKTAKGKAKFAGEKNKGYLKVSFFGPFFGDYKIIKMHPNYQWSVVTSSSFEYLWILSRQTQIPKPELDKLLKELVKMGFNTEALIWVTHKKKNSNK